MRSYNRLPLKLALVAVLVAAGAIAHADTVRAAESCQRRYDEAIRTDIIGKGLPMWDLAGEALSTAKGMVPGVDPSTITRAFLTMTKQGQTLLEVESSGCMLDPLPMNEVPALSGSDGDGNVGA